MAKNREKLAELLGAKLVGEVPDVGGGALGMARLAHILHQRLTPSQGARPDVQPTAESDRSKDCHSPRETLTLPPDPHRLFAELPDENSRPLHSELKLPVARRLC